MTTDSSMKSCLICFFAIFLRLLIYCLLSIVSKNNKTDKITMPMPNERILSVRGKISYFYLKSYLIFNSLYFKKNQIAGNNKNIHNTSLPPASGTVTTSPTTPTSTSSNHTSFAGSGPALPSLKSAPDHVPLNNFNAQEVSNYLNNSKY
jgi:hypothetical protein